MSEEGQMVSIYVLPTEPGKPPQAVIGQENMMEEAAEKGAIEGALVLWSQDMGTWMNPGDGMPLDSDLASTITEHAKSLGVEW